MKVAKRDIVCYKVVHANVYTMNSEVILRSAYRNFVYVIGKTYKKRDVSFQNFAKRRIVNGEGYHSFTKRVVRSASWLAKNSYSRSVSLKCVIPKGTAYFVGKKGDKVSRALRIVSAIDWVTGEEVELKKNPRTKRGFSFHRKRAPYRAKNPN